MAKDTVKLEKQEDVVTQIQFEADSGLRFDKGNNLTVIDLQNKSFNRTKDFRHDEHFVWFTFDNQSYKIPMKQVVALYLK